MRHYVLLVLVIVILVGGGCLKKNEPTKQADSANFEIEKVEDSRAVGQTGSCSVSVEYPKVTESVGLTHAALEKMNAEIEIAVNGYLAEGRQENVRAAVERYMNECEEGLLPLSGDEFFSGSNAWSTNISYTVERNSGGIFTLGIVNGFYTGGAHPNMTNTYFNFDLGSGKALGVTDLIMPEKRTAVAEVIADKLLTDYSDMIFEDQLTELAAFKANVTGEVADRILMEYGDFALTNDGFAKHYEPYEIAPYAAGPIDITVTATEIPGALVK